jgi:GNAT superfamily N-acetyltransferase
MPRAVAPAPPQQITPELFTTRRARLHDLDAVNALHQRCSLENRYARYATPRRKLEEKEWSRLVHPAAGVTWLTTLRDSPDTAVAVTHLLKTRSPGTYELAVLIDDPRQGAGLGGRLTEQALRAAADEGCRTVTATLGAGNRRAIAILRRRGVTIPAPDHGVIDVTIPLLARS